MNREDLVLDLLADADPAAGQRVLPAIPEVIGHTKGASDGSDDMTTPTKHRTDRERATRWRAPLAGAAVAIAAVAAFVVLGALPSESDGVEGSTVFAYGVATTFEAGLNGDDLSQFIELVGEEAALNASLYHGERALDYYRFQTWMEADVDVHGCSAAQSDDAVTVRCSTTVVSDFSRAMGIEQTGTLVFTVRDGLITEWLHDEAIAFSRLYAWVGEQHAEHLAALTSGQGLVGPRLTEESARLHVEWARRYQQDRLD